MSKDENDTPQGGNYEVGYRKPPVAHQFKPGDIGNPRGRRKGVKNESTVLKELFAQKIPLRKNGRVTKVLLNEAIYAGIAENALLRRDLKSAAFLLNRYNAVVSGEAQPAGAAENEREILEGLFQRWKTQENPGGTEGGEA